MKEMPAGRDRYRVLDTYRFFAASGVVFYHFENHFQPFLPAPTHLLERFQFFVDFFFVLSVSTPALVIHTVHTFPLNLMLDLCPNPSPTSSRLTPHNVGSEVISIDRCRKGSAWVAGCSNYDGTGMGRIVAGG